MHEKLRRYRLLGEGEAYITSSVLTSLGRQGNRGDRVRMDIGFGELLSTFGISAPMLEGMLQQSVFRDGLMVHLNGTLIAEQLNARGFPVPSGVFPERIDTRVPVAQLVDVRALIAGTVQALARGDAMALDLAVADGIEAAAEKWPPVGNVVLLEARHFLAAVKATTNRLPLMQMLNLAAPANRSGGSLEAAALREETPVADSLFDRDIFDYSFMVVAQVPTPPTPQPPPLRAALLIYPSFPP